MKSTLLVAGATGLVGSATVHAALRDDRISRVITWGRRPLAGTSGQVEFWGGPDPVAALRPEPVDAVICCLGTTIKAVKGDKQAFIHVDHDLVVALGRWASGKGVRFCVVSAIGADANSIIFYNQVKGRMESALKAMDFAALHIFQPSILDGPRTEKRMGERIGLVVMHTIAPLLPAASRPMPVATLGKALVHAALSDMPGTYVHSYREILGLAR